ncbi:hypothetical protein [Xenorhabdus szentirmaii]|uniref:hypothetical protein n=1 Tax=Xenorhabdus szentirmaii TaxID=290112 RepID=UPI0019AA4878|nr:MULTISPECIES: hypothetical protein [unclassified Xenorhabdus]MBD2791361.1 hypothetical protein [Xenorhabdus sp. CUL]MBD2825123.1 hypothetical protein [Xenorhabdus sp. 5]
MQKSVLLYPEPDGLPLLLQVSQAVILGEWATIVYASVQRNAQIPMKSEFFIYNPSDELLNGMKENGVK